jgi:hypothetical protein
MMFAFEIVPLAISLGVAIGMFFRNESQQTKLEEVTADAVHMHMQLEDALIENRRLKESLAAADREIKARSDIAQDSMNRLNADLRAKDEIISAMGRRIAMVRTLESLNTDRQIAPEVEMLDVHNESFVPEVKREM